ncbi:bifunctional oligoribonuclease/PAP phosphatase NrnA [Cytobacillus sp. FSL W7-1323]|uniref:DHH family phosphoesterase n=1 Tax=unclassified Cytobacillus TaxID=2675268 RepID=UPI002AFE94DE|nr:bifunctional oligoribonuclease/PAP phosphatase NrnA [Cytobacillus sp. OWB-43]MEA1853391.1 bifunctional oligoribonuclease/PAP phosphatase NrnA [Cytobacillus sp. OWB-43]
MKSKILSAIKKYDKIIIHRHIRPDPDAYGSQGGLAEIIKASFPQKQVYTVGQEDETLLYLRKMDKISNEVYEGALVIVCDTANTERISDQRYTKGDLLIKIDHHPNMDPYGDLLWVDTEASSVSEMIYEFFLSGQNDGLIMTDEAARLIFAGIVGDTGRFIYPSTTNKTFAYAGELIKYQFSRTELFDRMYELAPNLIKLQGYILQHFHMLDSGAAVVKMDSSLLQKYEATPAEASVLVGELGHVKELKAWVFFIEEEDQIRVRFRSKGPIINQLARCYKGGGHPFAAGASIYSWDEAEKVISDLNDLCESWTI